MGRAEREVLAEEPQLQEGLVGPASGAAKTELREEVAGSVLRWWFLHYRAWAHGVFGAIAWECSSELDPRGRDAIGYLSHEILNGL
jgi:hypothetical protein